MSDFDDITGPAGLNEEDVVNLPEVVEDEEVVDEVPLVEEEGTVDDGSMTGDEESDEAEIHNYIYDEVYGDQN